MYYPTGERVFRTIDAGDGLVLPGFIDAHCHPLAGGTRDLTADNYCDVSAAQGLDGALEACRRCVRSYRAVTVDVDESSCPGACLLDWVHSCGPQRSSL
jgi:predicted amidohydrolase YtcJ